MTESVPTLVTRGDVVLPPTLLPPQSRKEGTRRGYTHDTETVSGQGYAKTTTSSRTSGTEVNRNLEPETKEGERGNP